MSDKPDEDLAGIELAAAELIARVKQAPKDEIELPIMDESCVWKITVKKLGIRANIVLE